jgi:hypothetical protein
VAGSCEQSDKPMDSIEFKELLNYLRNCLTSQKGLCSMEFNEIVSVSINVCTVSSKGHR